MRKFINSFCIISLLSVSIITHAQVFIENFESGIPNTWAIFDNDVGTGVNWEVIPWGTANNAAFILYDCSVTSDAEDWLITPQIIPTATDNFLRFFQADPDASDYGSIMTIRISTMSQTNPADFTTIYTQGESVLTPFLESHQIDLNAYINQPIYIAFVMTQNCGDRWVLDDVEVRSECTIDLSITQVGTTLTVNQTGATYEWIDCGGTPILGETNQSFTATVDGQYSVNITTNNGCTEAAGCYYLAPLSVADNDFSKELLLYPNPTAGNFSINLGKTYANVTTKITDLRGRLIQKFEITNKSVLQLNLEAPEGIYILIVDVGDKKMVKKIIKK